MDPKDEVLAACRRAVLYGRRWRVYSTPVPAPDLVWIYTIREAQLREAETATLGFTSALEALRSLGNKAVCLGYAVGADNPPYHFQLFLNHDSTAVVACLGFALPDR
ncbi:hypothetical protein Apa02nite_079750 [Actinoplanes palleronii]|uniref:Uncharacterized protein n=1 Tax=Actinoplanes palleronii TaxID=113570 RepID=A0ABQ4BMG4_9ACTN|nr:hypothetical protein Apa02nite_079750 [Actinoplanes palleronii]